MKFILVLIVFIFYTGNSFAKQEHTSKKKIRLKSYSTNSFLLNNIELFLNLSLFTNEKNLIYLTNNIDKKDKKNEKKK